MVRRHGQRSVDPDAPVVDVDLVVADDLQIDLIGRQPWPDAGPACALRSPGAHRAFGRHRRPWADEPVLDLLDQWRLELADRPLPEVRVSLSPIPARSNRARHRRRSWRPIMAVAAAIGAVLVGSATVGAANADPRSPLWPITQVIWPARAQSIESTEHVQVALDEARLALAAGRSGDARHAIIRAVGELGNIDDPAARNDIRSTVNLLWARSEPPAARRITPANEVPSEQSIATGPPGSASGPMAGPDRVADGAPVPASPGSVGTVDPAVPIRAGQSGSPAEDTRSIAATDPATSVPATAAPDTAASAASAPSAAPTIPPTVPDPAHVVEPPTSDPARSSSPAGATQQSAPTPSPTPESSTGAGSFTAWAPAGPSGGALSPAAADGQPATSATDAAGSG